MAPTHPLFFLELAVILLLLSGLGLFVALRLVRGGERGQRFSQRPTLPQIVPPHGDVPVEFATGEWPLAGGQ